MLRTPTSYGPNRTSEPSILTTYYYILGLEYKPNVVKKCQGREIDKIAILTIIFYSRVKNGRLLLEYDSYSSLVDFVEKSE